MRGRLLVFLGLVSLVIVWRSAGQEPKPEEIAWIKKNAIVFETAAAGHGFEDLMPLREMIGEARIVALGESTHGTREIFQMKHRLVELLASEMGFTIFSIEANMPEAYRVNDYVLKGEGDPKELLKGMYFWTWDTQEVLDMILWMREFNKSGKGRIEFTGFDMQTPTVAARIVQDYLEKVEPEYVEMAKSANGGVGKVLASMRSRAAFVGVVWGTFPVEVAAGKRLRYSGYIKTEGIKEGFAGLWGRIDGKEGRVIAFDNMGDRGPRGTTAWERYEIELEVPEDAAKINFGVLHPGDGTAWFDSLKIELDGEDYVNPKLFDLGFESPTPKGFPYRRVGDYRVELDKEIAHSGKQSLRIEHVGGTATPGQEKKKQVDPRPTIRACEEILKHMESSRESYVSKSSAKDYEWAVQNARIVLQSVRMYEEGGAGRDQSMAENVRWILEHAPPGTKIVLWAHNSHVMKQHPRMGAYLDKWFGDEMVVLGFACNRGKYTAVVRGIGLQENDLQPAEPGSVEYFFYRTGLPRFILDLRKASPDSAGSAWLTKQLNFRWIGARAMEEQFSPWNVHKVFDGLVYFEDTTASRLLRKRTKEAQAH